MEREAVISESELQQQKAPPEPGAEAQTPAEQQITDDRLKRAAVLFNTLQRGSDEEVQKKFAEETARIATQHVTAIERYCCLAILESDTSIDDYELDRVFSALAM